VERRVSMRAQVDMPISALAFGVRHACRAIDISPAGMVFEQPRALEERGISQVAPFEIYLPSARPIRARGRVVWARKRLLAVKFVWMNDADRLTLAELLDRKVRLREPLH
jgi:PilZ domain